jgi:hypothetical protein
MPGKRGNASMKKEIPLRRAGYYHLEGGRVYPSVTTILQVIKRPGLANWTARQAVRAALDDPSLSVEEAISKVFSEVNKAADRGSLVHKLLEVEAEFPPELEGYKKAYDSFKSGFSFEVLDRERVIYSDKHKYAGTLDLLAASNGTIWLIDFKTGGGIYPEFALQLRAYKEAVEEMELCKVGKTAVLRLGKDGKFEFSEMDEPFEVFLAAKKLWKWSNEN